MPIFYVDAAREIAPSAYCEFRVRTQIIQLAGVRHEVNASNCRSWYTSGPWVVALEFAC